MKSGNKKFCYTFQPVQVKKSGCCFLRELVSFGQWLLTRSPPIGNDIEVGRFNNSILYVMSPSSFICVLLDNKALPRGPNYILALLKNMACDSTYITIKLGIICKQTQCFFLSETEREVLKFCFSQVGRHQTRK